MSKNPNQVTENIETTDEVTAPTKVDAKKLVKQIALRVGIPVAAVLVTHILVKKLGSSSDSPAEITQ